MMMPKLGDRFTGTVICMDWVDFIDGALYKGFWGDVTIIAAEEVVGFVPTGHNSANWIARITGDEHTITLMGCQVRAIIEGNPPSTASMLRVP